MRTIALAVAMALAMAATPASARVSTGIDVLEATRFAALRTLAERRGGRLRVAVLTNPVGRDAAGRRTIDVLRVDAAAAVPGLRVVKLFSGEHGIDAAVDGTTIDDKLDRASGLPIVSLYGPKPSDLRPTPAQLADVDAVVIDLQDVGVRYWTFQTLTKYMLEAAAPAGIEVVVLDRPNPVNGVAVQGPVSTPGREDYVNPYAEPMRPGLTLGELASFFNKEGRIGAGLTVVRMTGWRRTDWYDATGLLWINPSPNLRSLHHATLYPGLALLEGTNVNLKGPGEPPFVRFGAPWIRGTELAAYLNDRGIAGVAFLPVSYVPSGDPHYRYIGERVEGVEITVLDRDRVDVPALGIEVVAALWRLYGERFEIDKVDRLLRNRTVLDQIRRGVDPRSIAAGWKPELERYKARRARYLLY